MSVRSWIVAGAITVGIATASVAAGPESAGASCGQEDELAAAKRALEIGNREDALRHLKNAKALLDRCIRYGVPAQPEGKDKVADTQAG